MTSPQPAVSISRIGQIAINVQDLKRATAFYRDTLGLKFLFEAGALSFFDCGGVRLMLTVSEKPEFEHLSSVIYYRVPEIQAAYKALLAQAVKFEGVPHVIARMPEHELWMAFFRDSENNLGALMSEVPKSPATAWRRPGSSQAE